jgi:hypothetical protein
MDELSSRFERIEIRKNGLSEVLTYTVVYYFETEGVLAA